MSELDLSAAVWQKASRSGDGGDGNCVEIAFAQGRVFARDSKDPAGAILAFEHDGWIGFLSAVRGGTFDRRPK